MLQRAFFWREIIGVLAIKLLLLGALWGLFFSHPIEKQLTSASVGEHLITPLKGFSHD